MDMKFLQLPKEIKEKIIAPLPTNIIKERDGGRGVMLSYISGSTVIDLLNAIFSYMWSWEVEQQWMQDSYKYFNQYSKVPDSQKVDYNGKRGAWEEQAPVAHVRGRLTVNFLDENGTERQIIKVGYGSKSIIGKQSEQESAFKSAGTDALKKAASLLGIGLELYRDEEEQGYFNDINYEDPWTEEMQTKYQAEREFLKNVMETYSLDEEAMAQYVSEFSEGTLLSLYDIVPDNIESFAAYLKSKIEASDTAAAAAKSKKLTKKSSAKEKE
jgi:recombination DNA repair RAD52 pathway protein